MKRFFQVQKKLENSNVILLHFILDAVGVEKFVCDMTQIMIIKNYMNL